MKIIIHGGFFSESSQSIETKIAKQEAIKRILKSSYHFLQSHDAFDTAVNAVMQLEDDPLFNAGFGSMIQSDGSIRMSASIMNGKTKKFSGVINIEKVKNPISVASLLIALEDRVLGGSEATKFARENGFDEFDTETSLRRKEYEEKCKSLGTGTVGAVIMDKDGLIVAATSTGGKGFEIPGRISDSATVAGNYANEFCGVSLTGVGEDIVSSAIAAKIVTRVTDGFAIEEAFAKTFDELLQINGFAGAVGIDSNGNIFHQDSHPTMVYGWIDSKDMETFS